MPECYIADRDRRGRELVFPSPHTPLNWATAELLQAFAVRSELVKASNGGKPREKDSLEA
jgi:hypothetical protein